MKAVRAHLNLELNRFISSPYIKIELMAEPMYYKKGTRAIGIGVGFSLVFSKPVT
jgi:hypothetical protein